MLNLYDNMIIDANLKQEKVGRKYYKHIGELKTDNIQVVILFRTIPGEAYNCLVIGLKFLSDVYRDSLVSLLQSTEGQSSFEFGTYLYRQKFPDGVNMLEYLHQEGFIKKILTNNIIINHGPNKEDKIELEKINKMIASEMNISVDELAIKNNNIKPLDKKY